MSVTRNSNATKSPKLQGTIVENILLLLCKRERSIDELVSEIELIIQVTHRHLKKHLVYLIDYGLITYNGQRKILLIEEEVYELLDKINNEKIIEMIDSEDIIITIEKESSDYLLHFR